MELRDLEIYRRKIPARMAEYADYPEGMEEEVCGYLRESGISSLYRHQAEMFSMVQAGKNVVITTSTASGKTLSFLLPVLQEILKNPLTRAIFIYPTKALAGDQFRALRPVLEYFGPGRISAGVYDGDTPPAERSRIRKSANIILTNPEMLNGSFLPNHSNFGFDFIFSNLKFVVVDELHTYRGAFGSHLANVFRRLFRVCGYYHAKPQFLCSSATIANPVELAETICGQEFMQVSRDGSPAAEREYVFLQPPAILGKNGQEYGRVSSLTVATELIPALVEKERHFIAFARSRRNVEVVLKESRDKLQAAGFLGEGLEERIAGYRGGYTPQERKEIEQKMISGQLSGLVSTNALELGIDIGKLDTTVIVGYPGSRASFWQQTGRAGRNGNGCTNYLILENAPFDQYIAIDPDWLLEKESEYAIVDKDNLQIQLSHIRAAAAEMPLTLDDIALFPDLGEVIPVLLSAEELKDVQGRFAWSGGAFPAGDFSLRNIDQSRYQLLLVESGKAITEMDEMQAYRELHPGAVYLHEGVLYEVTKLDTTARAAQAIPFNGNYYTVPAGTQETRILRKLKETDLGRVHVSFGDIHVNEVISMYKKLQFHNHQNLGNVQLAEPLSKAYDTEGCWITIPENVVRVYRSLLQRYQDGEFVLNNHFEGLCSAIKNAAMMVTMTAQDDIDAIVSNNALIWDGEDQETVSLFLYDKYVGGLGYAEKIYGMLEQILQNAVRMVENCSCADGCPACVGDYKLDKKMVLWGLQNFQKEREAPRDVKAWQKPPLPRVKKAFSFGKLEQEWDAFVECLKKNGETNSAFFGTVAGVQVSENVLELTVGNQFYEKWASQSTNRQSLLNVLRFYTDCPAQTALKIRAAQDTSSSAMAQERLKRKLGKQEEE
ncbi:MAG: DEAD/DEAH box helicase [Eubacteriales bacterium]|nr:DEAD/DEAH box helicase [Eubacteriales bacterium]